MEPTPRWTDTHYMRLAWLLIGLCAIGRFFYAQGFLLVPDETNYWQWARHLDWSYHDQAPMIAWTIYLTTWLLGHTEAAVRLPSIIAMTVASVYLVLMARRWFNARIAWHTALVSQAILLFNVGALLSTSDGLQAAAWAAAAYHTARAFESDRWPQWIFGGVWFGFGMLSKYTMVLFLPCVLAYALLSRIHRKRMAGPKPYIACAVGLIMFAPVILWNAAHDWNSVRHVAHIGGAGQSLAVHFNFFGDYVASQAALLTPLVFILICGAWIRVMAGRYPRKEWIYPYLFYTSFPVIAGFAVLSLHTRIYGNWPGAGYATATLLATALWCLPRSKEKPGSPAGGSPRKIWWWSLGSAYLLTGAVLLHVLLSVFPIPPHLDRAAQETVGWDRLGRQVARIQEGMPRPDDTFLFGLRYQIASELAFYVPGQPYTVSINRWSRPNVYDYWWQDSDLIGRDAVGVLRDDQSRERLMTVFEQVQAPEAFTVYNAGTPVNTFYIYRCYGFKGGLRWIPPHARDVRAVSP
jgi:hypothetical protein